MNISESPIVKLVVYYSLGILLGKFFTFNSVVLLFIIIVVSIGAIALHILSQQTSKNFLIIILIISLGCYSITLSKIQLPEYSLDKTEIKNANVFGRIETINIPREETASFILNIDSIKTRNIKYVTSTSALCKYYGRKYRLKQFSKNYLPGNYVKIKCKIFQPRDKRNPGEFDYRQYLMSKGIVAQVSIYNFKDIKLLDKKYDFVKSIIYMLRLKIYKQIAKIYSGEEKHLVNALILGERKDLDKSIVADFINSGTVHVLAVSGLHVGFIVGILFLVFGRFNLFLKSGITIIGILLFIVISGGHPSVIRASVMAIIMITAFVTGREYNSFNILALAGFILLVVNPAELFNPGFQLSFAAVFSILFFYPYFEKIVFNMNIKNALIRKGMLLFSLTLAAQIGTLPITLIYFKKLSLISFFINILIVPLIGVVVALAVASLLFSVGSIYLGSLLAVTNSLIIKLMFYFAKLSSELKYSHLTISNFSWYQALLYFGLLSVVTYAFIKFRNMKAKVTVLVISVFLYFTYAPIVSPPILQSGKFYVIAIDIGQGDSFLIIFPNRKTALVDAGNSTKHFDNGRYVIEPLLNYLGIDKINYLFISHIDADHYRGSVSLIYDGFVERVYKPVLDENLRKDLRFENYVKHFNIPINYYYRSALMIGGAKLYFLNDTSLISYRMFSQNNKSGVLKLCYGEKSILFTGDLEGKGERLWTGLYESFLKSDVLKVGHHGSKFSTSELFLNRVKPTWALISAGENNKFGHPNFETIARLNNFRVGIKRTDKSGAIILSTDGNNIKFIDWK